MRPRLSARLSRRSLVEDGRGLARAARLACRAERQQVVFVPGPLARAAVDEWPAPRVLGQLLAFQVRPVPAGDARRPGNQRLQTLGGRRIDPNIQLVDVEHSGEALDRLVRDLFLGGAELSQRGGRDEADQQPQNGEHDQELEQRKTSLPSSRVVGRAVGAENKDLRRAHCGRTRFFSWDLRLKLDLDIFKILSRSADSAAVRRVESAESAEAGAIMPPGLAPPWFERQSGPGADAHSDLTCQTLRVGRVLLP